MTDITRADGRTVDELRPVTIALPFCSRRRTMPFTWV